EKTNNVEMERESTFYKDINACSSSQIQTSEKPNNVEIKCKSTFSKDKNACYSLQIQAFEETNNVEMECESTFYVDINTSCSSSQIQLAFESSMSLSDTDSHDDSEAEESNPLELKA
ncbi:15028_t:CDS:2, partial [Gigaspora rosea]